MYNFFRNRSSKKAFIQALKEIEKEGYFVSRQVNDDVVFTTNMSRAVAALSDDQIDIRPVVDKTLDISGYAPNIEIKSDFSQQDDNKLTSATETQQEMVNSATVNQSRKDMYEQLFSDDVLLNGTRVQERGLLSNEIDEGNNHKDAKVQYLDSAKKAKEENQKRVSATKTRIKELNAILLARKQEKEKQQEMIAKAEVFESAGNNEVKLDVEAKPEIEKFEEQKVDDAKIIVEVVASKDEEPKEEDKKIVSQPTIAVQAAIKSNPTVNKSAKTTSIVRKRKKKRRFDADIAGGFDF